MKTFNITWRKQPIGITGKLMIRTRDGNAATLKSGETAALTTGSPLDELYVKHFLESRPIKTGITEDPGEKPVNLELFYNRPATTINLLLITSVIALGILVKQLVSGEYVSAALAILFITFAGKIWRDSLTIRQLE